MNKTAMKDLTAQERSELARCLKSLENNQERDPKYQKVIEYLIHKNWIEKGCIVFSQYFDSIWWLANQISNELPDESIGIYAGGNNSGIIKAGNYQISKIDWGTCSNVLDADEKIEILMKKW
jgi:hypothetical protein